jgi:hypothetical protein
MTESSDKKSGFAGCCGFDVPGPGSKEMAAMMEKFCGEGSTFDCSKMMEMFRDKDGSFDVGRMMEMWKKMTEKDGA